jgi:hypothetical protein
MARALKRSCPGPGGPQAEASDFEVADFGQTIRRGPFEAGGADFSKGQPLLYSDGRVVIGRRKQYVVSAGLKLLGERKERANVAI